MLTEEGTKVRTSLSGIIDVLGCFESYIFVGTCLWSLILGDLYEISKLKSSAVKPEAIA